MRNPFAGILSLFTRAGAESVCGVDFGSSALKVVQLKKKEGAAVLETYGAVALGPYVGMEAGRAARLQSNKLVEALHDVMREAKITATQCGVAVSMSSSMIAAIELPLRPEQDASQIIPIEARKYIPTPISEVALDWRILPPPLAPDAPDAPVAKTEVLITAIHRDALERLKKVLADAGLLPSFLEIEIFATARAARLAARQAAPAPDAAVGVIDIGASLTKISIIDRGVLRDAHVVSRGGQDLTLALAQSLGISVAEAEARKRAGGDGGSEPASAVVSFILAEAREVFAHYEARAGRALEGVVFSGGGALSGGLLAAAEKAFSLPVTLIDPMMQLAAPAFLSPLLARAGPEFAVAIGAALRRLEEVR